MDVLELMLMKSIVNKPKQSYSYDWRLTRVPIMDNKMFYYVSLDEGNQSYHYIAFSKSKYNLEDVANICKYLALELGIQNRVNGSL